MTAPDRLAAPSFWRSVAVLLRQAARLGRRTAPGPLALVALGAAFVVGTYTVLAATTLSPAQLRDKEFGTFTSFGGYGAVQLPPGNDAVVGRLESALSEAGADRFMVSLTAVEFYVAGLPRSETRFEEHPWQPNPYPRRYHLTGGRWPTRAGEVAVTRTPSARVGTVLGISGARAKLTVVGVVRDDYARQPAILAAPGTWASLDSDLAEQFVTVRAQPTAYWSGGDDVLSRIENVLVDSRGEESADEVRQIVRDSHQTAPPPSSERRTPWLDVDRVPAGYAIPSVLLPILTTLLAFAMAERRLRRLGIVGQALGLPPLVLLGGCCLALTAALCVVVPAGGLVGRGITGLFEPVLERVGDRPVDLRVDLAGPILRYVGLTVLTALLASVLIVARELRRPAWSRTAAASSARTRPVRDTFWRLHPTEARRVAAIAAFCAAVLQVAAIDSPGRATVFSATLAIAALALIPDLMRFSVRLLPESRWQPRLVRRRLEDHKAAATASVAVLSIVVGTTFGYLVLVDTWLASDEATRLPKATPGQVMVANRNSNLFPPPANALDTVARTLPVTGSVRRTDLAWTVDIAGNGDTTRQAQIAGTLQPLLVVPDRAAVAAVLDRPLTAAERSVLDRQGVLAWAGGEVPGEPGRRITAALEITGPEGERERLVHSVPMAVTSTLPTTWQAATSGIVERRTADAFGLPRQAGARLYTQVPAPAVEQVRDAVAVSGIDPETVRTHQEPARLIPAIALPGVAAALGLLLFGIVTLTTWTGAGALRRFTALLACLGIAPSHAKSTVTIHHAFLFGHAVAIGVPLAVLPAATTVITMPDYVLSIPWLELVSLGAGVAVAGIASHALALTRLRAAAADGS